MTLCVLVRKTMADITPPVISILSSGTPGETTATITWSTNEAADSQVEYGLSIAYGSSVTQDTSAKVINHSVALSGLNSNSLYYYRVRSSDAAGNTSGWSTSIFTTAVAVDVTPPVITAVSSGVPGSTSATITWTTDEVADSQVEYGSTIAYGNLTPLQDNVTRVVSHNVVISLLSSGSLYHYRVLSRDSAGNLATSGDYSFTTAAAAASYTWYTYDSPAYPRAPGYHGKHLKSTYDSKRRAVYLYGGDTWLFSLGSRPVYKVDLSTTPPTMTCLLNYADSLTAGFPGERCVPCFTYDRINDVCWMHNGMSYHDGGLYSFDPATAITAEKWHHEAPDIPGQWSHGDYSLQLPNNPTSQIWWSQVLGSAIYSVVKGATTYLAKYDLRNIVSELHNGISKDSRWSVSSLGLPASFANCYYLYTMAMCVDTKRGHIIMHVTWETGTGETWQLNPLSGWTLLCSQDLVTTRGAFGLAYDSANDYVALFGGANTANDSSASFLKTNVLWLLSRDPGSANYHTWVATSVTGSVPTPRRGEAFCYDEYNNKYFVTGGTSETDWNQPSFDGDTGIDYPPNGYGGKACFTISLGSRFVHADLAALGTSQARDCGAYPFIDTGDDGGGINANTATDYSGFSYDPIEHCMLMGPTGGHSATFDDSVKRFSLRPGAPLTWVRDYPRTLRSTLHTGGVGKTNIIDSNGFWTTSGNPISRHTYKMTPFCPNVGKFAVLSTGVVFKSGDNITWSPDLYQCGSPTTLQNGSKVLLYNPLVKASSSWSIGSTTTPLWGNWDASCYDPVSGKVLVVGDNDNHGASKLYTYDPQSLAMVSGPSVVVGGTSYDWEEFNLVYCPENDYFYIITRSSLMVVALKFDRTTLNNSTFTAVTITSGSHPVLDYIGYAWDSRNKIIGGGPVGGYFFGLTIDPADPFKASWSSKAISVVNGSYGAGTLVVHSFACDYDESNGVFIFISDSTGTGGGRRTFAYRWA